MLSSNDKIKMRIRLLFILLVIPGALYIIGGLYNVQIINHEKYLAEAKKKYTTTIKAAGKRGEIFTSDGFLLVANNPCVHVFADASIIPERPNADKQLAFLAAKYLQLDYNKILKRLNRTREKIGEDGKVILVKDKYIMLKRNVSLDVVKQLKEKMQINKLKGLGFENTYQRYYPKNSMLANILGFTVFDDGEEKAVFGLEKSFNAPMTSTKDVAKMEISRDGRPLSYGIVEELNVKDGKNIYLTVNEVIQSIMEEELDNAVQRSNPKAIYAVMLNPANGNIMAIAQRPTFNPNNRKTINVESTRPRIIADVMEPGSIIKPFTVAFAIDNNYVTPRTMVDCENGYWIFRGKPLTDSHRIGKVSVTEVIKQSSNIGTAKLGILIGAENVYNNLFKFGFGQKSGIPLKPESIGTLAPVRKWDGLTVSRIPMGYSLNVTPLQMVRAYGALANHGYLHKLRLIDRIEDPDTGEVVIQPIEPPVQMFKNPETAQQMVEMMIQVTEAGGTATKAAVKGYHVAGKTGTSRKFIPGEGYSRSKYFASFIGFVPAESAEFVLLVTVDEPRGKSYYGGSVAGPVFSAIAERTLKYLNIPPYVEEKK